EALRAAVSLGLADGQWGSSAAEALGALHAGGTDLAPALAGLSRALEGFAAAAGSKSHLETMCIERVLAGERLHGALADPVKALHPASPDTADDPLSRPPPEKAPPV